jgi:ribonuclease P/MRP protein subunit POP1
MARIHGFSLPLTPTQKSFRPTYRASHHSGFIAFDTSYFSTFFLHGTERAVKRLLEMVVEYGSPATGKRYSKGGRSCESLLYRHGEFPRGMIGPALVLWKVLDDGERQVMVRIHPSITNEVWEELHICVRLVEGVCIEDARFEIGAIDVFGPMANEVLFAVLKTEAGEGEKVWSQLRGVNEPKCLPMGAVIDLNLRDPRIEYPLKPT